MKRTPSEKPSWLTSQKKSFPNHMVQWLFTESCLPSHRVTDLNKLRAITQDLTDFGWWGPALVGYYTYDKFSRGYELQLLTGAHRWAAARHLKMRIPILIFREADVEDAWGDLERWQAIVNAGDSEIHRTKEFFCA